MRYEPISPEALVEALASAVVGLGPGRLRVAIDGPPAADPGSWAQALVGPLRVRGRPAVPVPVDGFLRAASLRFERGRTNPDSYYESWFDLAALGREVLDRFPSGTFLPSLWDPETDRATRAPYVTAPPGAVLLLSGPLLLGAGLAVDYAVHLDLGAGALARRTPADLAWTLPAFARYADEVAPETFADAVVRVDHPDRPAVRFMA